MLDSWDAGREMVGGPICKRKGRGVTGCEFEDTAIRQLEVQGVAGQILESPTSRSGEE